MKKHISYIILAAALALGTFSCNKDLNRIPINTTTSQNVFSFLRSNSQNLPIMLTGLL